MRIYKTALYAENKKVKKKIKLGNDKYKNPVFYINEQKKEGVISRMNQ